MVVQDAEESRKERKASGRREVAATGRSKRKTAAHAMKNQVCAPLFRPPSPFLDLCYVDATLGAVEGARATNDLSGEQLMGDRPADAASPPPGSYCHRDA